METLNNRPVILTFPCTLSGGSRSLKGDLKRMVIFRLRSRLPKGMEEIRIPHQKGLTLLSYKLADPFHGCNDRLGRSGLQVDREKRIVVQSV